MSRIVLRVTTIMFGFDECDEIDFVQIGAIILLPKTSEIRF